MFDFSLLPVEIRVLLTAFLVALLTAAATLLFGLLVWGAKQVVVFVKLRIELLKKLVGDSVWDMLAPFVETLVQAAIAKYGDDVEARVKYVKEQIQLWLNEHKLGGVSIDLLVDLVVGAIEQAIEEANAPDAEDGSITL